MDDIDLHLQGHLGQKYLKFGYFRGLICMVNYRVIFSLMAFPLCTNRVHIGMLNIHYRVFFQNSKIQNFARILTVFQILGSFTHLGCAYRKHEGALIGGFTWRTVSVGGAYLYCLQLIGWLMII